MRTPAKKISFQMPARQAYTVLDWIGDAIKATSADDPALKAVRLLQSQLRSALRAEIGTQALQKELFGAKPDGKSSKAVRPSAKGARRQ